MILASITLSSGMFFAIIGLVALGGAVAMSVMQGWNRWRQSKQSKRHSGAAGLVDADEVQPIEFSFADWRQTKSPVLRLSGSLTPFQLEGVASHEEGHSMLAASQRRGDAMATPKRKLFLSWAAVQLAVRGGAVGLEDLDDCLFCTSVGELNLAEEFDQSWFERLHPVFVKAAKEGRLICNQDRQRLNATATWEINLMLKRNGIAPLSCVDQNGTLDQIPMYSCVPSLSDGSMEVLWAAHPLRGDWRSCWGRSLEEIDAAFADLPDEPEAPRANWMDELNQPIIDEARLKFEKPGVQGDGPGAPGQDGKEQTEEEDPADFWKKGRTEGEE